MFTTSYRTNSERYGSRANSEPPTLIGKMTDLFYVFIDLHF